MKVFLNPEPCSSMSAAHDLAALSAGNLSEEGLQRLARHIPRCPECMQVLESMIGDTQRVEASGVNKVHGLLTHCRDESVRNARSSDE